MRKERPVGRFFGGGMPSPGRSLDDHLIADVDHGQTPAPTLLAATDGAGLQGPRKKRTTLRLQSHLKPPRRGFIQGRRALALSAWAGEAALGPLRSFRTMRALEAVRRRNPRLYADERLSRTDPEPCRPLTGRPMARALNADEVQLGAERKAPPCAHRVKLAFVHPQDQPALGRALERNTEPAAFKDQRCAERWGESRALRSAPGERQ